MVIRCGLRCKSWFEAGSCAVATTQAIDRSGRTKLTGHQNLQSPKKQVAIRLYTTTTCTVHARSRRRRPKKIFETEEFFPVPVVVVGEGGDRAGIPDHPAIGMPALFGCGTGDATPNPSPSFSYSGIFATRRTRRMPE